MRRFHRLAVMVLAVVGGVPLMWARPQGGMQALSTAEAAPPVRAPAAMGSFYPAATSVLRDDVQYLLDRAEVSRGPGELVAIIVPHGRYSASGRVAGYAYRLLQGLRYDTVAIIGPSHQSPFDGVALSSIGQWFTPLGLVPVDLAASEAISRSYPAARVLDAAHDPECSIEVQLPFLRVALGQFSLLPMLMSDFSDENCRGLAQALSQWARDRSVLLVASSDMSHHPSYDDAVRVDRETLKAIETMDPVQLTATTRRLMSQGVPGLSTCLCGEGPVKVVLMAAKELGADRVQVLNYANSGDLVRGAQAGVVGYCAVALYRSRPYAGPPGALDAQQQQRLLAIARQAIEEFVRKGWPPAVSESDPALTRPGAAFVTLRKSGELRGRMGSLEAAKPLVEEVRDQAIAAATRDPRFPPVRATELGELEIEVSVLTPISRVLGADQIDIAKHGVLVRSGSRQGSYLPQVAQETGWSREVLLTHLCREEAGLPGDAWKKEAELYVFTAQVFFSPAPEVQRSAGD